MVESECVEVGEDTRGEDSDSERERGTRVMGERLVLGAAHLTPLSQKALHKRGRLHDVTLERQVVYWRTRRLWGFTMFSNEETVTLVFTYCSRLKTSEDDDRLYTVL